MTWDQISRFKKSWLFRALVLLLVLVEVSSVAAMGGTLASFNAQQSIRYANHTLQWDSDTEVDASGVAELKLFSKKYQNVESDDDEVFAPGTKGSDVLTLVNEASKTITYVALAYNKNPLSIPYVADMDALHSVDTTTYVLPEGVDRSQVIRAVTGQVTAGDKREFNIHWEWPFYFDDSADMTDTIFGIRGIDEAVIGFWIYVEEEEDPVPPPTEPDPTEPTRPHHPPRPHHPDKPVTPTPGCPCDPTPGCPCTPGGGCPCNPGGGCGGGCGGNGGCGGGGCGGGSCGGNCGNNGCGGGSCGGCGNNCCGGGNCGGSCGSTCGNNGCGENCACKPTVTCTCGKENCTCGTRACTCCHCCHCCQCAAKKIVTPKTGDNSKLMLYAGMTVLCGAALAFLLIDPKKKEHTLDA